MAMLQPVQKNEKPKCVITENVSAFEIHYLDHAHAWKNSACGEIHNLIFEY
jgi:hypothetical protein